MDISTVVTMTFYFTYHILIAWYFAGSRIYANVAEWKNGTRSNRFDLRSSKHDFPRWKDWSFLILPVVDIHRAKMRAKNVSHMKCFWDFRRRVCVRIRYLAVTICQNSSAITEGIDSHINLVKVFIICCQENGVKRLIRKKSAGRRVFRGSALFRHSLC